MDPREKPTTTIWLNEQITKITDYYIHRSVHPSKCIRKASCNRQQSQREPQLDGVLRMRDFGALGPEWNVYLSPPLKAQGSTKKRNTKIVRARGDG